MPVNTFSTLGDILLKKYIADFNQQMKNPSSLYNLMKEDSNIIPEELRCQTCKGPVTYGGILMEPCPTCSGKGIPPIPTTELLSSRRRSKGQK